MIRKEIEEIGLREGDKIEIHVESQKNLTGSFISIDDNRIEWKTQIGKQFRSLSEIISISLLLRV